MWRSKKVIIASLLAVIVLVGSTAGVVLAQNETTDQAQPKTLIARVAEILGIDQQKLEDAVTQARTEMQNEALDTRLQKLVDEGKLTQEQADQYQQWWQDRPDTPLTGKLGPFGHGFGGGMRGGGGFCFGGRAIPQQ